ncbi:hypothetical protein EV361DRAFT_934816 [Lentinula raphanica]|nr:hypothetical protein EV361DRAFT_934816 [Lentinula raphanica]
MDSMREANVDTEFAWGRRSPGITASGRFTEREYWKAICWMTAVDVANMVGLAFMFCMIVSKVTVGKAAKTISRNTESGTSFPISMASFRRSLRFLKNESIVSSSRKMWLLNLLMESVFLISSFCPNSSTNLSNNFFALMLSTSGTKDGRSAMNDSIMPLVRLFRNLHSGREGFSENTGVPSETFDVSEESLVFGSTTLPSM